MDALIDYCQDYYKHYDGYPVDFEYKDKVYPYEYYARYLPQLEKKEKEFGMKKIIIEVTSDEQLTQVVEDLETYVFRGYDNPPNMYIEKKEKE